MVQGSTMIPRFYLYGEPHRLVEEGFVHVENLVERSRAGGWHIHAHMHAALNHLIHLDGGGGAMVADGRTLAFEAPCLLIVPAGVVHGFDWQSESTGSIVTLASQYLQDLGRRDPALGLLFAEARAVPLGTELDEEVGHFASRLLREHTCAAPGHRVATDIWLAAIMVAALRALDPDERSVAAAKPSPQAALVTRFRALIEERFYRREPVSAYADVLGVSLGRLQLACARILGEAPSDMIDQRVMLEARRALLHTNLSVAEVGYALGFADPGYFSRFFTRHAACSPRAFRQASSGA